MKKLFTGLFISISLLFAQYFDGDVLREFGVKTGIVRAKYDSVDGSNPSRTLEEFLSVYGYLGAQTTTGFTAGASIELSSGSYMTTTRTVIYNALELNPSVELSFSDRLRAFTGFGGSLNRFKERAGLITNESTNLGMQFFFGLKYNFLPSLGLLGEYKGKIFMTGDYDGNVIHHFNIGLYFLIY